MRSGTAKGATARDPRPTTPAATEAPSVSPMVLSQQIRPGRSIGSAARMLWRAIWSRNFGVPVARAPASGRAGRTRPARGGGAQLAELRNRRVRAVIVAVITFPVGAGSLTAALMAQARLDVQIGNLQGVPDNELPPWLNHVTHQRAEYLSRIFNIPHFHLQQGTRRRIERGMPELVGVHLSQTFELLDCEPTTSMRHHAVECCRRASDLHVLRIQLQPCRLVKSRAERIGPLR